MTDGISISETQTRAPAPASANPLGFLQATWNHWKKIARAIGVVQTRILMVFFYFVFVVPVGMIMRMGGDPLHLKRPAAGNWTAHHDEKASVDTARRQF
ncbi:MAG: hypothetical protein ACHQ9S_16200 [Candidatus Binatia bacterium]